MRNAGGEHVATVGTNGTSQTIAIPAKVVGPGSGVNGGELLFLALATCYCNDIYREAARLGIEVEQVEVEVDGEFGGPGEPTKGVRYNARVVAHASEDEISELMRLTDTVAEIQNTLRAATPVTLEKVEAVPAGATST